MLHPWRQALRTTLLALAVAVASGAAPALADPARAPAAGPARAPGVLLGGDPLPFDVPPVIEHGHTLVPMRALLEALGASVEWDAATRTITATKPGVGSGRGTTLLLQLDSPIARVNGVAVSLPTPAVARGGRTLVPLRFVAETLGLAVRYDEAAGLIYIDQLTPTGSSAAWLPLTGTGWDDASDAVSLTSIDEAPAEITAPADLSPEDWRKVQAYWTWYGSSFSPAFDTCNAQRFPANQYSARRYQEGRAAALAVAGCFRTLEEQAYRVRSPLYLWDAAHRRLQAAVAAYARAYYVLAGAYALGAQGEPGAADQQAQFAARIAQADAHLLEARRLLAQLRAAFDLL
jgi:hypothetical protein